MASPSRRPSTYVLRSLLGVALAVAFTPIVSRPQGPGDPSVHETTVAVADSALDGGVTLPLKVKGGPELIALTWDTTSAATFEVRAHDGSGWGSWYSLEGLADEGPDSGAAEATSTGYAGPAFLGRDITDIQLRRTQGDTPGLVVHAIDSEPVAPAEGVASATVPTPPTIITRAQWGADEGWRDDSGGECDGTPDYSDDIQMATVHHTDGRNDYTPSESAAIIRGIYDFHVHSNGWCDVAYNFFVDRYGQIFEGRYGGIRRTAIGGHTSGFNTVSTGVAVLGTFDQEAPPQAAYDALVHILAFKLGYHGVDPKGSSTVTVGSNTSAKWPQGTSVTLQNIQGHGDSNKTSCPGTKLEALLPQLRNDVAQEIATKGLTPAFTVSRLSGPDRYSTAATIAKATFGSAGAAYLARSDGFADALAANYLAGQGSIPVLLASTTTVPPVTLDALHSLGATTVHLLGGTNALGPDVESALRSAGFTVDRISGADRFETAAAIARAPGAAAVGLDGGSRKTAILSSGRTFPDALAAGGIVFGQHYPQLLSEQSGLPPATISALTDLGIQHVLLTGGTVALADAVEQQVKGMGIAVDRISGATRYDTSVALANLAVDQLGFSAAHVDVATGENFPDALTGGAHVGKTRSPLILTTKTALPEAARGYLHQRGAGIGGGHIFGGTSAVEGGVKYQVDEAIQAAAAGQPAPPLLGLL
jgi:putative cell wall-binding protein